MEQPSLIDPDTIDAAALTSSPTSAAAPPARARRRPDTPAAPAAPPTTPGGGLPTDMAGRAAWLMAGEASEMPARFDALVDLALAGELRALAEARRAVDDAAASMAEAEAAIPALERALLREQSQATHAALDAGRNRINFARDVLNLARREVPLCEERLEKARNALAASLAKFAASSVGGEAFVAGSVVPIAGRWWALMREATAIRDAMRAAVAAENAKVEKAIALARLAGVPPRGQGLDPYAVDVTMRDVIDGHARKDGGTLRDFLSDEGLWEFFSALPSL